MVILPTLLLAVTASAPVAPPPSAAPAPVTVIDVHAPTAQASMAPTAARPATVKATPGVKDPFAGVVARVIINPAPSVLHDPFAPTNIRARYRHTAPAAATLRDPFSK